MRKYDDLVDYEGYEPEDGEIKSGDGGFMPESGFMPDEGFTDEDFMGREAGAGVTREKTDDSGDWAVDGLDKKYDEKCFDLGKAQALFKKNKLDGTNDINSQREAIRYANYFAKKGNDDAKEFIVSIIQNRDSDKTDPLVVSMAYNSFALFFRNYVRVELKKYYALQPISDSERYLRIQEGVQECFVYITEHLDRYDPTKGKLTTFFTGVIMRGTAMEYEAKRKGRGSKQTMKVDKIVANAEKELIAAGINPTVRQIALHTGKNVEAVINSKIRMAAENTMGTIDSPDFGDTGGGKAQSVFVQPERNVIDKERAGELSKKIDALSDIERKVFLTAEGFDVDGDTIMELEPKTISEVAEILNLSSGEARFYYNMAQRKLRAAISGKTREPDRLLSGRHMTFTREGAEDIENTIEGIVAVF